MARLGAKRTLENGRFLLLTLAVDFQQNALFILHMLINVCQHAISVDLWTKFMTGSGISLDLLTKTVQIYDPRESLDKMTVGSMIPIDTRSRSIRSDPRSIFFQISYVCCAAREFTWDSPSQKKTFSENCLQVTDLASLKTSAIWIL